MKHLAAFLVFGLPFLARAGGDYVLELNGKSFEMSLDTRTNLILQNGQTISATLKRKDVLTFDGQLFSFDYKNTMAPQRVELAKGIFQTTLTISPVGSIIIVQEYTQRDPLFMIDRMVSTLTRKDVAAGYQLSQENAERHLADGTLFKGKRATTILGKKQEIWYVLASSQNGQGVLIMTHVSPINTTDDAPLVEAFWKSLQIKPQQ